ncbi:MAG: tRNA (N6-isopentenyl adenosine(37)-C2)-methylthiotransferase MiaB, partial [Flavobacteriales bacterium]|nr:tRNA (N6-isopentenyl adenosine(37)-C2)-methylthiotransferase MiaB [Flavobacteriales bacterium]
MSDKDVIIEDRQGEVMSETSGEENVIGKVYIESYGCQMNFSDSEIVASIMKKKGYGLTTDYSKADLILVNTCAIRDNAEKKVRNRLKTYNALKKKNPDVVIGVLGCMAERLKSKLLEEEKLVDIVAGPDAYRDLPNLVDQVSEGKKAINVILSKEETYEEIEPVRLASNGVTAFISITRGCDNMCSFCVVPFTRGRERSRNPESIIKEARDLFNNGYREVTLLGQNVDSYLWHGGGLKKEFDTLSAAEKEKSINFAQLLEMVSQIDPLLRIRFSTSHPKDMTDEVLRTMARYHNICNYIHLPVQSGSTTILEKMNRGYSRDWYKGRINAIREIIEDCGISADIISGFCSETEADHQETLSLMEWVKYDFSYMFKYSERPKTMAERKFEDDVKEEDKGRRLEEIIKLQNKHSLLINKERVGKTYEVLIEGVSKRSAEHLFGRNTQNTVVVFPNKNFKAGQYVYVKITDCTSATLIGRVVDRE